MTSATIKLKSRILTKKNGKTARISKYGKLFMQPKKGTAESETALHFEAKAELYKLGWKCAEGNVKMRVEFSWNGRADAVGLLETILDSLEGVAYIDDKQARWVEYLMLPKGSILEKEGYVAQIFICEF